MNLLILSSSTGGGHNMRAYALKDWWKANGGTAMVSQPLESTFKLYKYGSDFYNFIQRRCPRFHLFYFFFLEFANLHRKKEMICGSGKWVQEVTHFKPDVVVSVHAHLNHGYFEILQQNLPSRFRFVIYCGEMADSFGFSRHWVNSDADYFLGPFSETCDAAIKRGMPVNKTLEVEPLLRTSFYKELTKQEKDAVLTKYDIQPTKPILLLGTGANGVNRHLEVLSSLSKLEHDFQVVALCGRNLEIYNKILLHKEKYDFKILPLQIINDYEMAILLETSKLFFTRPGAGSTTEAVVCGTPVIFDISGGIMPQERNNLNFWSRRSSELITIKNPMDISRYISTSIPRIKVELESSPNKLITHLEKLCS
jgi:processive 1,2-diacylglycerol beta-glucosyltransferase